MNEGQQLYCGLCKRNCSTDDLQCRRGQKHFERQTQDNFDNIDNIDKNDTDNRNINRIQDKEDNDMSDDYMSDNYKDIDKEKDDHNHFGASDFDHREEDLLGLLLRSSHFLHHRRGGRRGQGKILKILAEYPQISQKELQERLGIESGSMSELVIKLEHKGLITREKDESDKRMTTLRITELGLSLSKELEAEASSEEQSLLNGLSTEEQEQLKLLLTKLLSGWEEASKAFQYGKRHKGYGHHDHHGGHHSHHKDHSHHKADDHHQDHSHHKDHDHVGPQPGHGKEEHREHHGHHRDHDHHSHHDRLGK